MAQLRHPAIASPMEPTMPTLTTVSPARFFTFTVVLSWAIWIPLLLSHLEIGPLRIAEGTSALVRLFGVLMPATVAIVLTSRGGGRQEVRALLGRLRIWRVGLGWWAAALLLQPAFLVVAALLANALAGSPVVTFTTTDAATLVVSIVFLLIAVLGEEIGWHGVALPALQQRTTVVRATWILGAIWAAWHLPFWLLMDTYDQFGPVYLLLNVLFVLAANVSVTWLFNGARFSILLPVAFHFAFNVVNTALLPVTMNLTAFGLLIAMDIALAVVLLPRLSLPASRTSSP
jgi:membrane protease YdiL (CAAX protease family)